jgi:peptidoglycan-associated lipoprotein
MEKGNPDIKYSGFFTSNRPGGKGKDDIYYFKEPAMEFALIGTVYDEETGTPISGADVTVLASNGDNFKLTSDGNGGFSLEKDKLKGNVTYTVDVAKKDYIGTGDKFSTVGLKESTTFAREYFMKPIVIGKAYDLPEVRYDYNKADLQVNAEVNSKDSLNYLFDLMTKNPTFVIQLESHTDSRGDDKYNEDLAHRRAQSCETYLVTEKGIDTDRINPKGMGEKEPRTLERDFSPVLHKGDVLTEAFINKLPTEADKEMAHQLNRRTIFKILRTDFVPKK